MKQIRNYSEFSEAIKAIHENPILKQDQEHIKNIIEFEQRFDDSESDTQPSFFHILTTPTKS